METLFKSIRDRVQQRNIKVLAKKCDQTPSTLPTTFQNPAIASLILKATSKHIDMPALVIQWNPAGFNNDPASPNNRNGVVGQNQDAVINSLQMAGAINYGNTIFMFRDSMQVSNWEFALPNWVRHQPGIPDVAVACYKLNTMSLKGIIDIESYPFAFNRLA